MSTATIAIRMIDQITAPARAMARALSTVTAAEKAVATQSKVMQTSVNASGVALSAASVKATRAAAGFNAAAKAMKQVQRASNVHGPILNRSAQRLGLLDRLNVATKGARDWNAQAGVRIDEWKDSLSTFGGTPFGLLGKGALAAGGAIVDVGTAAARTAIKVVALGNALGAAAAIGFTKQVVEMRAFADQSKRALGFITGSDALGLKEWKAAVSLSSELGTNVMDTVGHYAKLRSMQFSAGEATGLIRLSEDLKAITGDALAAERALTAMTQIKAKGRLQSEELVGQLAEAGVSTTLVYEKLEQMLGKDRKGVLKALQAGQIDADTGLVAITRALKSKYHIDNLGDVAETMSRSTLAGQWQRMTNLPSRMVLSVADFIDTRPLAGIMDKITGAIESIDPRKAAGFVDGMVRGLDVATDAALAFGKGFADSFHLVQEAMGFGVLRVQDVTEAARGAGRWVADFFGQSIRYGKAFLSTLDDMFAGQKAAFQPETIVKFVTALGLGAALVVKYTLKAVEAFDRLHDSIANVKGALGFGGGTKKYLPPPTLPDVPGVASAAYERMYEGVPESMRPGGAPQGVPVGEPNTQILQSVSKGGDRHTFNVPITINGAEAKDPQRLAETVSKEFHKNIRRLFDGEASQA